MDISSIVSKALPIIFSNEGGYGSVNKNDNGALSVGRVQWHGNRALSLLKTIVKSIGADAAKKKLGDKLYNEITKSSNWSTRILSEVEADNISELLATKEGKQAQDDLSKSDITTYIKKGQSYGLKDEGALIYFADGVNQYGTGSDLWENISKDALKSTGDIEAIYVATKKLTSKYLDRRATVYKKVIALGLNEASATPVVTYTVKKGDTLNGIAAKYKTTVDKLVKINKIKNANAISIGQKLKLS